MNIFRPRHLLVPIIAAVALLASAAVHPDATHTDAAPIVKVEKAHAAPVALEAPAPDAADLTPDVQAMEPTDVLAGLCPYCGAVDENTVDIPTRAETADLFVSDVIEVFAVVKEMGARRCLPLLC